MSSFGCRRNGNANIGYLIVCRSSTCRKFTNVHAGFVFFLSISSFQVIHDCRMVSDMLHHQFDVNIVNVFDTQVRKLNEITV